MPVLARALKLVYWYNAASSAHSSVLSELVCCVRSAVADMSATSAWIESMQENGRLHWLLQYRDESARYLAMAAQVLDSMLMQASSWLSRLVCLHSQPTSSAWRSPQSW